MAANRESLSVLLQRAIADTKGMNQSLLAERSGVKLATLNAWVKGRRVPANTAKTKEQLREIAKNLSGVTVADLFESVGQRVPGPLDPEAERRVMGLYRSLSPTRQRLALQMIEALAVEERAGQSAT